MRKSRLAAVPVADKTPSVSDGVSLGILHQIILMCFCALKEWLFYGCMGFYTGSGAWDAVAE